MATVTGKLDGVNPRLRSILNEVSAELGLPIQVNSGFRKGDSGQHGRGLAADIQIRHLPDEQKAALVRMLHQRGVPRFITYDTSGHLHVDLSMDNGEFWPMHTPAGTGPKGGSNRHISKAPDWYRNVISEIGAPSAGGQALVGGQPPPPVDSRMASAVPMAGVPPTDPNTLPDRGANQMTPVATPGFNPNDPYGHLSTPFDPNTPLGPWQLPPDINDSGPLGGGMGDALIAMGAGILGAGQGENWFGAGARGFANARLQQQKLELEQERLRQYAIQNQVSAMQRQAGPPTIREFETLAPDGETVLVQQAAWTGQGWQPITEPVPKYRPQTQEAQKAPSGYRWTPDEQLEPIPGGPAAEPQEAAQKPPSGYRWTPDGSLEPIPGGPATKTTEGQRTSASFYERMLQAEGMVNSVLTEVREETGDPSANFEASFWNKYAPGFMQGERAQRYDNASRIWLRAKLRRESGASIGDEEAMEEYKTYFPQIGDSAEVIAQKRKARQQAMDAMRREAGPAADNLGAPAPAPAGGGGGLAPGESMNIGGVTIRRKD